MECLANNSCKDYLIHAVWTAYSCCSITATCLHLLLLTTITTSSIPHVVAATETYSFPSSNLNDSLFSYANNLNDSFFFYANNLSYFQSWQTYLSSYYSRYTIVSCNNGSLLQALSTQERLYGRATSVYSAHYYLDYTLYFQLYFVISADELCSRSNSSTPSYFLSLVAYKGFGKAFQDTNKGKVVWTANVDNPVGENTCLHLSPNDTNLKLVDYDRNASIIWQTNTFGYTNASLSITYEGNLVLFTNATDPSYSTALQQRILWQSFDYPTDTLMVLQALRSGMNLTAASTTESTNKTAIYTLAIDNNGTLTLYAKIQYKALNNNTSNTTADYGGYGYPYLVWSVNGTQEMNRSYDHAAAVLCWYPGHRSSLQLDIVPSSIDGSDVISNYNQISPDECSKRAEQSSAPIIFKHSDIHDDRFNITFATFLRLESDGDLHAYTVNDTRYPNSTAFWQEFARLSESSSINPCRLPLFCGFYGVCDIEKQNCTQNCSESNDLEVQDSKNAKLGCKFKAGDGKREPHPSSSSSSSCGHGSNQLGGSIIEGASYFSSAFLTPDHTGIDAKDCWENHCKDNCTCTAAFWELKHNGSRCFLIQGPVATIIFNASATKECTGYLKFMQDPDTSSPITLSTPIKIGVSLAIFVFIIALLAAGGYVHRRRRLQARQLEDYEIEKELLGDSLLGTKPRRFTWKEMHEYTCGFSDPLGGGGFGNVFRGATDDGTPIAVKQLIDGSQQGNKEFIAEVSILGRTHHLQLVRLVGFCLEGTTHKLLVYEYMENGSLDAWIFSKTPKLTPESEEIEADKKQRPILSWERRFAIALGTAKGLAYLHEECEDRIIHMDLKPQNILLGVDFFAKISDFGMSRRVVRGEQTAVVTMMRGTPGYLAPEWLTEGAITEKCDVYSYGIVLLEIVSGRRVRDWRALRKKLEMRSNRGEGVMELVDERLMNYGIGAKIYNEEQALRMVDVAMLCVQTDPRSRPSMSSVVQMLEGKVAVIPHAPIDYYEQMELFPSEKMRRDGLEELGLQQYRPQWSLDGESSKYRRTPSMMSKFRNSFFSGKIPYKYMEISTSEEYMDSLARAR